MEARNTQHQPLASSSGALRSGAGSDVFELDYDDEPGPGEWYPTSTDVLGQLWFPFIDSELELELLGLVIPWKAIERETVLDGHRATAVELERIAAIEQTVERCVMDGSLLEDSQYDFHWRRRIERLELNFYHDIETEFLTITMRAVDGTLQETLYLREAPIGGEPGQDPDGFYRRVHTTRKLEEILSLVTQIVPLPDE